MMNDDFSADKRIKEKLMNENNIVPLSIHQLIIETELNLNIKKVPNALLKYIVACLLIFTVGFTVLGMTNLTYAQKIPVIGSVFKALDQMIFFNYDDYSTNLNISSVYNGYKVTINEVSYDGISLAIAYTISSKSPIPVNPEGAVINFKINGKDSIKTGAGNISGYLSEDKKTFNGITEILLSRNNYISTEMQHKTSISNIDIPDKFNLKINIISFYEMDEKNKKWIMSNKLSGNWNFNTSITNEKLKGKVREIKTAINLDKFENGFRINKLIITPLNTIIQGSRLNEVHDPVDFFVSDNYGGELPMKEFGGGANFMATYREIYNDTKALTFIPIRHKGKADYQKEAKNPPPELFTSDLNLKGKTTIPLGKHGNMEITKVEISKDRTNIYYKSPLGLETAPLYIIDKTTNQRVSAFLNMAKYLEDRHEYVVTLFTALEDKKYLVECYNPEIYYKIYDNQKFTVAVNN